MPRTKEQSAIIRAEKRQMIMNAALKLFAEDGYAHTSIGRIAQHAKISKGLMYTYFKSKEDLMQQILMSGYQKISYDIFKEDMTAKDFVANIERVFDNIETHQDFLKLYTAVSVQSSVTRKLTVLVDAQSNINAMMQFYQRQFGKDAVKEMLLMTTLIKGFFMMYLYGEGQTVYPVNLLKETVVSFIKEKFNHYQDEKNIRKCMLHLYGNHNHMGTRSQRYGHRKKSR